MNHPNREQLAAYVYKELPPSEQAEVAQHLAGCADCRAQAESWQGLRVQLGAWKVPLKRRDWRATWQYLIPWVPLKFGVAAAVLVFCGYMLAQFTTRPSTTINDPAIRAAIATEVRNELRAELVRFTDEQSARQDQFRDVITRTLGRLEAQRLVDYATLRRDVETVAIRAQDELLNTRKTIADLASLENNQPPLKN